MLELPDYKLPQPRSLAIGLWTRATLFLKRAGTTDGAQLRDALAATKDFSGVLSAFLHQKSKASTHHSAIFRNVFW